MRSHVLHGLWLCFAVLCSVKPTRAGAIINHPIFKTTVSSVYALQQQKDTTVKPSASPVVITPSSAKKDTTKPATTAPVVITPNASKKDTAAKPATASPVVITPSNSKDTSGKTTQDTTKPASGVVEPTNGKDSTKSTVIEPTNATTTAAKDTTKPVAKDTALILPSNDPNATKSTGGEFVLHGIVKDPAGDPIPGAQVMNLRTKQGVASGVNGAFSLSVSMRDTVKVSSISYGDQSIPVTSQDQLSVTLTAATNGKKQLHEVVVTALGIERNTRAVGYAVEEVGGNAVQEAKEVNFVNALTGKVPGLQINTNTGSMGGSSKITIRGVKSITSDNNAFVVVDGTPFVNTNNNQAGQLNGGGGYDYGSSLQDINPEDIDNISVLKGAAATALYGSRGANGVLLITTKKRPDVASGIGITYSINAQMDQVYVLPTYQNEYGGGTGGKFDTLYVSQAPDAFKNGQGTYDNNDGKGSYDLLPQYYNDASWGPKLNGQLVRPYWSWDADKGNPQFGQTTPWSAHPNNVRDFYRTGFTLTNNISMGGSSDKGYFRLSYGNMNQTFILPNATMGRNNLSFNGQRELAKGLRAEASVNYANLHAKARPGTGFTGNNPTLQFTMYGQRQLDINEEKDYKYPDGSQRTWNRTAWNNATPVSSNNPFWNQYMEYETDGQDRLFGNVGLDYDANKWLSFSGRVFMDQFNTLQEERSAKDYFAGSYTKRIGTSREMNYQLTATIKKDFTKDFKFNATLGGNIMHRKWTTTGGSTVGGLVLPLVYNLNNSLQPATPIDLYDEKQINSAFAMLSFAYRNYLFLDLTGRADWSSAILSNYNPYIYPSASASFVFSDLLKQWKWLSFGKLRGSVSSVGNDMDPYQIYQTYNFVTPFGSDPIQTNIPTKYNQTIKPEISTEYETGLDLRFLDDHIGVNFTYYNRTTKNQILPLPISGATGYTSTFVNGGDVQNSGVEVALSLNPIRLKNGFRWDINANIARNRNKLLNLDIDQYHTSLPVLLIGTDRRTQLVSVAAYVGKPLGTILGTDYVYNGKGQKIVEANGVYRITPQPVPIGNAYPDYVGGITNSFSYKGVYLSALIDFQHGGSFFSYTNMYGKISGLLQETVTNDQREKGIIAPGVKEDGTPNDVSLDAASYYASNAGKTLSKANLYDASYVYLREVKLGYNLPESWFKRVHAQAARLSLYGRNLWLMHSNAPNVDPSNILNSSSNIQGIEGGALPSLRSYGLNLNVSF
jgi:TonB-linked SusC/RagA family outer membrane protein